MNVTLALAALVLSGGSPSADLPLRIAAPPPACLSASDALDAVDRREALPLADAKRIALSEQGGEVIAVRLCVTDDGLVYFVSVLESGGHVARFTINAATGSLKDLD